MDKKRPYRYCIVPLCTNTTISTPEKYFFHVPNDKKVRNMWCKLMKREALSSKSCCHCCEDHFNIESDTENLVKWKLCGGTLKLKPEAVPTKFDCQKTKRTCTATRDGCKKRRRIDFFDTCKVSKKLIKEVKPSEDRQDIEFVSCDHAPILEDKPTSSLQNDCTINIDFPKTENKKTQNKKIQVEQHKHNAQTQTIKQKTNVNLVIENLNDSCGSNGQNSSISSPTSNRASTDSYEEEEINHRENTTMKIKNYSKCSKLHLGIPKESYFVIKLLEKNLKISISIEE